MLEKRKEFESCVFLLRSENIFQREKDSSDSAIARRLAEMREDKGDG